MIQPHRGGFSSEHARYVLSLDFSPEEHQRFAELSAKAQDRTLDSPEQNELDDLLSVNAMLSILQSKARISLTKHNSAA
jgi:hypothetical protein